jgi:hypothetical protein
LPEEPVVGSAQQAAAPTLLLGKAHFLDAVVFG